MLGRASSQRRGKVPFFKFSGRTPAIKLQYNKGSGGCFPYHYDNPGPPSRRQLTCIVYLNPEWKDGDGGELRLLPFLSPSDKIKPLMDRLSCFGDMLLHRACLPPKNGTVLPYG